MDLADPSCSACGGKGYTGDPKGRFSDCPCIWGGNPTKYMAEEVALAARTAAEKDALEGLMDRFHAGLLNDRDDPALVDLCRAVDAARARVKKCAKWWSPPSLVEPPA